jgi:hypothetical protein
MLEDVLPETDHFNSLHEKLVARLQAIRPATRAAACCT